MKYISLIILLFSPLTFTQSIGIKIKQPPYNQLTMEDLWKVDLKNNYERIIYVFFKSELKDKAGNTIAELVVDVFPLEAGVKSFNPADALHYKGIITYTSKDPVYKLSVLRTGSLPPGDYQLCVKLFYTGSNQLVAEDCIQQTVSSISPPVLVFPKDRSELNEEVFVFSWNPPIPLPKEGEVEYEIDIVKVFEGQMPEQAIQHNESWYHADMIKTTFHQYPLTAKKFENGIYAWIVSAFQSGFTLGSSEVWSFSINRK
jgi:hypothetical protein